MTQNSSNRFLRIFQSLAGGDHETGLALALPLIDNAGDKVYKIAGTRKRFEFVLTEHNPFIYWFLSDGLLRVEKGSTFVFSHDDGRSETLAQVVYGTLRNTLLHEAALPSNLIFFTGGLVWSC